MTTAIWQPTLQGALVTLRPLTASDWSALFAVASDPLIWEQHPASNRYEEPVFRAFFDEAMASGGALLVQDAATGATIGSSRYNAHDASTRIVEVGYTFLARAYWGGKYNGEMKRLMLSHAFQHVDVVEFLIGPANIRSRTAVERIGARFVGHRPNALGRDSVVYQIAASAFAETTPGAAKQ
ncbi:MAG: GNAT family N-acetyltransferase [Gemmatimonadaceae bacterium]|nr:GNAT family N-acetyltransferase [Gemmatimonadaceae bacterium]